MFRYFKTAAENADRSINCWWHKKLADYFELCSNLQRKVEVRDSLCCYWSDDELATPTKHQFTTCEYLMYLIIIIIIIIMFYYAT